jgi:SAM-dependent methyltransferase
MGILSSVQKVRDDPEIGYLVAASKLSSWIGGGGQHAELVLPPAVGLERTIAVFNAHRSDKANLHSYAPIYAALVSALPPSPKILELGIGTNFTDIDCNMGEDGVPGASLRALRELRPDAVVYGADIDRRVLFDEPGISTFWVDQLDPKALASLHKSIGGKGSMDLIVDDGLHTKRSNLNTFRELFSAVKKGGHYVIEDIDGSALPFWRYIVKQHGLTAAVLDMRHERGNWDINNMVVIAA